MSATGGYILTIYADFFFNYLKKMRLLGFSLEQFLPKFHFKDIFCSNNNIYIYIFGFFFYFIQFIGSTLNGNLTAVSTVSVCMNIQPE